MDEIIEKFVLGRILRRVAPTQIWAIDDGIVDIEQVSINGWYIFSNRWLGRSGDNTTNITMNGNTIPHSWRPDPILQQLFNLPTKYEVRRFSARAARSGDMSVLEFGISSASLSALREQYYPILQRVIPEPSRRRRVHGSEAEFAFTIEGYSAARKLERVLFEVTGKSFNTIGRVLDWGCGCGRTARFVAATDVDLFGVDVDHDNVRWCEEHLVGNFIGTSTDPPLPFAEAFFDLIYGISVMTHLNQPHERRWLAELRRVLKPGGLAMLSVMAETTLLRCGMLNNLARAPSLSYVDLGPNDDLANIGIDTSYYRNVAHLRRHIDSEWGKSFEIVRVYPGIIGNNHDLVVLRRP